MHRLITLELHWLVFAGIILLLLLVGLIRFVVRLDRPTNHTWNVFYLMVLLVFILGWVSVFTR